MRAVLRTNLPIFLLLLLLSACTAAPTKPDAERSTGTATKQAHKAERTGEYVRAAQEYERAAAASDEQSQRALLQLKAVETLLKAGQLPEARHKIRGVEDKRLEPALRAHKLILEAQIASLSGLHHEGIRLLDEAQRVRNLDPSLTARMYRVRAEAELGLDNPIGAAKNFIVREQYLVDKEAIAENQVQLWNILTSLPRATLKRERHTASDAVLAGWLELATVAVENAGRPALLNKATAVWRRTHPNHPVSEALLQNLGSAKPGLIGRIERVAILVPLTSPYRVAAEAVLAGVRAMDAANPDPDKAQVLVYDIGDDPRRATQAYAEAVNNGAQLVIGPLGREAVEHVVRHARLSVPTLLLSHAQDNDDPLPGFIFQFGLPPEQEAIQAAERAYLDGHRQAAVLYAQSDWGQRMLAAFSKHWQELGGIVLTTAAYGPGETDHSPTIKQLLNISQSEARRGMLEAKLGVKLEFEERRREDIDLIFLAADAKSGRLLKPQLDYHHAFRIPIYATSHIFAGRPDQVHDKDLDGVIFGDMPWMLVREGRIEELRQRLQPNWPYAGTELDRLFALGVDSYAIIPHLNRISSENAVRFNGVTSSLSLGHDGRLHRQLLWARFRDGLPELLDKFINYSADLPVERDTRTAEASASRP